MASAKSCYALNNYRVRKLKDRYLITSDHGSWVILDKDSFKLLKTGALCEDKALFEKLKEKGIVLAKDNLNKVVKSVRERNSFLFHGPSLHIIVPTLRCNMNCVYCHASSKPIDLKSFDMDEETAKNAVDFMFQSPNDVLTIEFQGGEPLLNFSVVEYITTYARKLNEKYKKDLRIIIVTNLSLMDDKKLDFLINNNVGICTSLDGPKKVHDQNRVYYRGKGSYEDVIRWINKINDEYKTKGMKRNVGALITITRSSLKYPEEIIDEYLKHGFTELHLRFLHNIGDARPCWKKISYSAEEFIDFWKKAVDYIIELNKNGKNIKERMSVIILKKVLNKFDPGYLDLRSPCGAAIGQIVYDYDGKIYSCDEGRMVGNDIFNIGDVNQSKYKDVLTSPQTCGIIAASINDSYICDNCAYKPYCGICPVCNYVEQGNVIGKISETIRCKIFKAEFDYIFEKLIYDDEAKKILLRWIKK